MFETVDLPWVPTRNAVLTPCFAILQSPGVPSRRLEEHIRELCALATAAKTTNVAEVLAELRSALHEHAEQLRRLARQQLVLAKGMARTPTDGERVMPVNRDKQQRIVELVAEIEAEKDQMKFTALIHELNELLEGKSLSSVPPRPKRRETREAQTA
jgi:hypothetical protein